MADPQYYKTRIIYKRNGEPRYLEIPCKELKDVQRKLVKKLNPIICNIPFFVHGFIKKRSVVTHAAQHLDSVIALRFDINNFFWSCTKLKVLNGLLSYPNFSPLEVVTITQLCTCGDHLPQGAPTSPMLANLSFLYVDWALFNYIKSLISEINSTLSTPAPISFKYTRYADDIIVSLKAESDDPEKRKIPQNIFKQIIAVFIRIAPRYGFHFDKKKIAVFYHGKRPFLITGINIAMSNGKSTLTLSKRRFRNQLKSAIFHYLTDNHYPIVAKNIQGKLAWLYSVNPEHAKKICEYAVNKAKKLNKPVEKWMLQYIEK